MARLACMGLCSVLCQPERYSQASHRDTGTGRLAGTGTVTVSGMVNRQRHRHRFRLVACTCVSLRTCVGQICGCMFAETCIVFVCFLVSREAWHFSPPQQGGECGVCGQRLPGIFVCQGPHLGGWRVQENLFTFLQDPGVCEKWAFTFSLQAHAGPEKVNGFWYMGLKPPFSSGKPWRSHRFFVHPKTASTEQALRVRAAVQQRYTAVPSSRVEGTRRPENCSAGGGGGGDMDARRRRGGGWRKGVPCRALCFV